MFINSSSLLCNVGKASDQNLIHERKCFAKFDYWPCASGKVYTNELSLFAYYPSLRKCLPFI